MAVWLTQWLCPSRHCAFALAWDDAETTAEALVAEGARQRAQNGLRDRCGICGANELHPDHGPTQFKTMAEALPALRVLEAQQLLTRRVLDALGLTAEPGAADEKPWSS